MTFSPVPERMRSRFAFWALAAIALVVSHDAIFLAQLGPGEELTRTLRTAAHDYWGPAGIGLTAIGAAAAVAFSIRLRRLRRWADAIGAAPKALSRRTYLGRVGWTWLALFAVVAIGFAIQENVEHLTSHGHLIGAGALIGPEYPLALPVIGLITLAAGFLAAAFGGAERALVEAIAAVLRAVRLRPPSTLARAPLRLAPSRMSPLARSAAGRAPPSGVVAIT